MSGRLFTDYFLTDGIKETDEWKSSVEDMEVFAAFRDGVSKRYEALCSSGDPNEAVTEQELIRPILELLGWERTICPSRERLETRIFPIISYSSMATPSSAPLRNATRLTVSDSATAVQESKRFGLSLDNRDKDDKVQVEVRPHGQIRRYLYDGRYRVGGSDSMGHPDQRKGLASIRSPRPATSDRLH